MNFKNTIDKIKEARKDALKEKKYAEADGNSDYAFWDGYVSGMDQAIFLLEQKLNEKKTKKENKKKK